MSERRCGRYGHCEAIEENVAAEKALRRVRVSERCCGRYGRRNMIGNYRKEVIECGRVSVYNNNMCGFGRTV